MSQLITKGLSRHPVYFNEQAFISRCWNILCNSNIHIHEFVIIHQTAERERKRERVCERESLLRPDPKKRKLEKLVLRTSRPLLMFSCRMFVSISNI